jgi:hypothetical protein
MESSRGLAEALASVILILGSAIRIFRTVRRVALEHPQSEEARERR